MANTLRDYFMARDLKIEMKELKSYKGKKITIFHSGWGYKIIMGRYEKSIIYEQNGQKAYRIYYYPYGKRKLYYADFYGAGGAFTVWAGYDYITYEPEQMPYLPNAFYKKVYFASKDPYRKKIFESINFYTEIYNGEVITGKEEYFLQDGSEQEFSVSCDYCDFKTLEEARQKIDEKNKRHEQHAAGELPTAG